MASKRASYRHGVDFIAWNDEPNETDADAMEGQLTIMLLADLFGKPESEVVRDVLRLRARS